MFDLIVSLLGLLAYPLLWITSKLTWPKMCLLLDVRLHFIWDQSTYNQEWLRTTLGDHDRGLEIEKTRRSTGPCIGIPGRCKGLDSGPFISSIHLPFLFFTGSWFSNPDPILELKIDLSTKWKSHTRWLKFNGDSQLDLWDLGIFEYWKRALSNNYWNAVLQPHRTDHIGLPIRSLGRQAISKSLHEWTAPLRVLFDL